MSDIQLFFVLLLLNNLLLFAVVSVVGYVVYESLKERLEYAMEVLERNRQTLSYLEKKM
jgi:membrane carboxypeptidase/penicillin-binding protein PbpC